MSNPTGWQTAEAARRYGQVGDLMIPGRAEVLNTVADLVAAFMPGGGDILDLGCGYGVVTGAILQKAPETSAVLIDFSDEMIRIAQERFRENPQIKIVKHNLNEGLPDGLAAAGFGAVVSCFALHHIDFARRVPLYTQIRQVLKPGGVFINGDLFIEESPGINEWMFDGWMGWITDRLNEKMGGSQTFEQTKVRQQKIARDFGDKPGSLWDMKKDLEAAGFTHIDCLYKNRVIAVMAAVK
jgi:tRNA (cmo5U34)-methyltransferase